MTMMNTDKNTKQQLGNWLLSSMKMQKMSRTTLATEAGITREQLNWVLNGTRSYTVDTLLKVIEALNLDMYGKCWELEAEVLQLRKGYELKTQEAQQYYIHYARCSALNVKLIDTIKKAMQVHSSGGFSEAMYLLGEVLIKAQ